jgi:WD40 repeat protein
MKDRGTQHRTLIFSMIIATSGEEDRTDRRIRLWDAKTGQMIQWIDKETHKMIVSLKFHPLNPHWLISADMEHDVKLWDWTTGKLIRTFKKIHSRIIYFIGFLPEEEMRYFLSVTDEIESFLVQRIKQ